MLPHAIAFNAGAAGALLDPVRNIFGADDIGNGLAAFADEVGAPRSLRELGFKEADLDRAAGLAMEASYWNPRTLVRDEVFELMRSAWSGDVEAESGRG